MSEHMKEEDKAALLKKVKELNVKFIRLQFTDIEGILKSTAIPVEKLENALNEGIGFDGSSIKGYTPIEESDMVLVPDPTTFAILPWRPELKVARMMRA